MFLLSKFITFELRPKQSNPVMVSGVAQKNGQRQSAPVMTLTMSCKLIDKITSKSTKNS